MTDFIETLVAHRGECVEGLLRRDNCQAFLSKLLSVLFPHFSNSHLNSAYELNQALAALRSDLAQLVSQAQCGLTTESHESLIEDFFQELPDTYSKLRLDAEAIYEGDPAAQSLDEIILSYPGFYAIAVHRIAHSLYQKKVHALPRVLSEFAHERTGIDIHPGATIGRSFCIDHGTGIVIGETANINDNVKIYQGVTLGALSVDKSQAAKKRHPTIESDVVIYSGATILGGETVIGSGSVIGGNVWLTESVPAKSVVYHCSEKRIVQAKGVV